MQNLIRRISRTQNFFKVRRTTYKKGILGLIVLAAIFNASFQKNPYEQIIGSWTTSDCLETIVFNEQDQVIINNNYLGEYAIYDDKNIIELYY